MPAEVPLAGLDVDGANDKLWPVRLWAQMRASAYAATGRAQPAPAGLDFLRPAKAVGRKVGRLFAGAEFAGTSTANPLNVTRAADRCKSSTHTALRAAPRRAKRDP